MLSNTEKGIFERDCIQVDCHANSSDEAIVAVGNLLKEKGYVEAAYIDGMLARDHSLSTYIGNDVAIPHGEYAVKDYVLKTGIAVMVYPDGIPWADARVRLVIGIAAKNNEHMEILSNIAIKLCDREVVKRLIAGNKEYIYQVFSQE